MYCAAEQFCCSCDSVPVACNCAAICSIHLDIIAARICHVIFRNMTKLCTFCRREKTFPALMHRCLTAINVFGRNVISRLEISTFVLTHIYIDTHVYIYVLTARNMQYTCICLRIVALFWEIAIARARVCKPAEFKHIVTRRKINLTGIL